MCVLAVSGATKAATSLWDSMGLAAIGLVSLIVVVVVLGGAALILLRVLAPIVRDLKEMTSANALLAERLQNAIEASGCHEDRRSSVQR